MNKKTYTMAKAITDFKDNPRLSFFNNDLGKKPALEKAFEKLYTDKKGDWSAINKALKRNKSFSATVVKNLSFTNDLGNWTGDNKTLVGFFQNNKKTNSLRDIAINFKRGEFKELVKGAAIPKGETKIAYEGKLYTGLYEQEPTAIITNMILDPLIPLLNSETGTFISNLFLKNPSFNIKTTSVYELINKKDLFKDIDENKKKSITTELKALQRIASISPVPEAIPALMGKNIVSAFAVTQLPPGQFTAIMKSSGLPEETLNHIYIEAENRKIINEQTLIKIKEAGDKTGIRIIDGDFPAIPDRNKPNVIDPEIQAILNKNNLSWDLLFGDADFCECGECTSVYSAAAYYVDLLQYLRNNNIDPEFVRKNPNDISNTPLEKLFAQRPDLGHLELTCENTNIILPYVDLVNEVMEQYIAFKKKGIAFTKENYKGFNVADETSGELLSAPQHTEQEKAYQALKDAIFPCTLPYHQPIDAARIFLNHVSTSRHELIDIFRVNNATINFNSAADAEFLSLTEEEYAILTKANFSGVAVLYETYQYFGLANNSGLSVLSQVKKEFLPRTGIEYADLIELLKTQYLNPFAPKGVNLSILNCIEDSYGNVIKDIKTNNIDNLFLKNPDLEIYFKGHKKRTTEEVLRKFLSTTKCIGLQSPNNNCSLDDVRLLHLDGEALTVNEYDNLQRFIRLWRKLGYTIDETDKAIMSLGAGNITPILIQQLVSVKKIMSLTGIELTKLLCLWGNISTSGDNSLYKQLFLSHNLLAMDEVFKSVDGVYLNGAGTISQHLPVVMAALNLSADDIAVIKIHKSLPDDFPMTIQNLSLLYRYRLLSKTLGLRVPAFVKLVSVFGDIFQNADTTIEFFKNWNKIDEAGFNAEQLNFIITDTDREIKPFAPSNNEIIVIAKKIYNELDTIEFEHADLKDDVSSTAEDKATTELVRTKASILYDAEMVEKIISILEGTTLYNTSAPLLTTNPVFPANLQKKIRYQKTTSSASLQVTGALISTEISVLKGIVLSTEWTNAVTDLENQQNILFRDMMSGIFTASNSSEVTSIKSINTYTSAPVKRLAFIKVFLPYLREQLKNKFIVDTLTEYSGLDKRIIKSLVTNILNIGTVSLYKNIVSVQKPAITSTPKWSGKLFPVAESEYTFIVKNVTTGSPKLIIDGFLTGQQSVLPVSTNEWWSMPIKLEPGKTYEFLVEGVNIEDVYWKTKTSAIEIIPDSVLLPDYKINITKTALSKIKKIALVINGFSLSADELNYLHINIAFDTPDINPLTSIQLDFNELKLKPFLRIADYCSLRNSLPQPGNNILDFWNWINDTSSSESELGAAIAELTTWEKEDIKKLISSPHFNLIKRDFTNEKNLLKLQRALAVVSKIGMDINKLFDWASPNSDFNVCKSIADSIQKSIRAQYNQTDWEQVVKPLNDQLRNNQKNALIAYLLQLEEIKTANVIDANGLFDYFLIDVQMDTCMETSRIKQAISSVQLFIQRCFIGLEKDNGITSDLLDRNRWEWMGRYRVWEANRKVFLHPENWIESNLRDDKSPFFKELESELLQNDINKQNVEDALKAYLYKVDEVANMEVVGVHIETAIYHENGQGIEKGKKLHVFSRTRNAPYFFYYRYLDIPSRNWYPWEKMQVDIPSYDIEEVTEVIMSGLTYILNPKYKTIIGNGCYLTPIIWNNRLLIFFPQFMRKTKPNENDAGAKSFKDISEDPIDSVKQLEYWEIKLAYSEYRNGKWTQKQLSKDAIYDTPEVDTFWDVFNEASKIRGRSVAAQKDYDLKYRTAWRKREKWLTAQKTLNDTQKWNNGTGPGSDAEFAEWEVRRDAEQKTWDIYNKAWEKEKEALDIKDDTAAEADMNPVVKLLATLPPPAHAHDISKYEFVPAISANNQVVINIYYDNATTVMGIFEFDGANIKSSLTPHSKNNAVTIDKFHHGGGGIQSLQLNNAAGDHRFGDVISTSYHTGNSYINFYHTESHNLLGILHTQSLESFFKYPLTTIAALQKLPYANLTVEEFKNDIFGGYDHDKNTQTPNSYNELKRSYSIYNWELFFHTPMMLADALSKSEQFEEAMKWFHYVFNPIDDGPGTDVKRFWQFTPFKEIDNKSILERIFHGLRGNTVDEAISEWRNNPFKPHLVARDRPVGYMKWAVMKYIDNILDWGDYLFRQDTIESINQATQLYVLAGHILGAKPMLIPKRGKVKKQTYISLLNKWDAFSNAMSELEVAIVFKTLTAKGNQSMNNKNATPTADVFGSVGALYFCIPNNPKLLGYWDTLADRLFKIRHCQNIEGVFRKLPLFEPPIDPALLVKAAAQGLSISSVVNDLNSAMPNYRFYYLLQKALELCNELKSLGGAMLSAIEKKDNEAVSLIRARHEGTMNNLVLEIKKLQLEEAQKSLASLQQNRKAPEARMKYYLELTGEDANKLPTTDGDFAELTNSIEKPIDESGLRLSKFEKEDVDKAHAAKDWQIAIGVIETLASIAHVIPTIGVNATPLGIGGDVKWGGTHLGNALQAVGKGFQIGANILTYESTNAAKKGGFQRSLQERLMQANAAGYELKQIDKQITAQQIRIDIANKEINNQQKQIDNANEVEDFLKNKYTNEELYTWMRGSLKTLYHQVYNLAYELAKKAERTYCFERGISNAGFIQSGYFDAGREGLLAGEQLFVGLKQLEAAYQEKRGYDYEITKHISLRQLDPLTLIKLKATGKCEFDLPEVLFDMDYPGHFKRRIKSVSISIPCIAGTYTGVNASLRLLNNKFRNSSIASNANNYPEKTDEQDDRFISYNIPIKAIATSSAQNDSGMFELNFKDERYLPFEGAGVISRWNLELPGIKQFDYYTISDVVLHLKYTASEGGEQLRNSAMTSVKSQMNQISQQLNETGLHLPVSLKHDMPNEWNVLITTGKVSIPIDKSRLPYFAQAFANLSIDNIILISKVKITKLRISSNMSVNIVFNKVPGIDLFKSDPIISNPLELQGNKTINPLTEIDHTELQTLDDLILVVKYTLA